MGIDYTLDPVMDPAVCSPQERAMVEQLVRGFVHGAPLAVWTEANRFELCVMQVDEGFNFISIHQGNPDDCSAVIYLSKVVQVLIGVQLMAACQDNGIVDEHLDAWTGLAVVHGVVCGGRPTRSNLCVMLVDSAQKQQRLCRCLGAIWDRSKESARDIGQGSKGSPATESARNSMGPARNSAGPARNSMGAARNSIPGMQRPSLRMDPSPRVPSGPSGLGRKTRSPSPSPVPQLNNFPIPHVNDSRPPPGVSWQPPVGWNDESDEDESYASRGRSKGSKAHVSSYRPQIGKLPFPGPASADEGPWRCFATDDRFEQDASYASHHAVTLETLRLHNKLDDGDSTDEEDFERVETYRPGGPGKKPDPSCSDRMCDNHCTLQ